MPLDPVPSFPSQFYTTDRADSEAAVAAPFKENLLRIFLSSNNFIRWRIEQCFTPAVLRQTGLKWLQANDCRLMSSRAKWAAIVTAA